jgi:hypothetical protein
MPFIYDETNIEWPEDDDWEPPPPRADQFVYLSPSEYGGAAEPVRFSVVDPEQAAGRQRTFAFAVPELHKAGVQRLYCRYDGGHDEGFSRLDSAEMKDGARLDADALRHRLFDAGLLGRIYAAGMMRPSVHFSDRQQLALFLDHYLINEWAVMLLDVGYGTGEYSMYGAFTVDVTDDRHADPIVRNIRIAT